jgi:urease accessory protein
MTPADALTRLLQLSSPALPVGGYTYSQGLEWAAESGIVHDEASAGRWIGDVLDHALARFEAPLVARLLGAWGERQIDAVAKLNALYLASRETAELHAETLQMGYSMVQLAHALEDFSSADRALLDSVTAPAWPTAWTWAAAAWGVDTGAALQAYLWSWAENQVMAAIKAVPLGQSAGQRLLAGLGARIPRLAERAPTLEESAWSNFAPGFALASARHQTQYSRLFRS